MSRSTTPKTINTIPTKKIKDNAPPMIQRIPNTSAKILEIFNKERIVSASGGTLL